MTRLTNNEIKRHKEWLSEWRSPAEMLEYVREVNEHTGRYFLIQAGLDFLRDAWSAATFGHLRTASKVRLIGDEWPDFELSIDDRVERALSE